MIEEKKKTQKLEKIYKEKQKLENIILTVNKG